MSARGCERCPRSARARMDTALRAKGRGRGREVGVAGRGSGDWWLVQRTARLGGVSERVPVGPSGAGGSWAGVTALYSISPTESVHSVAFVASAPRITRIPGRNVPSRWLCSGFHGRTRDTMPSGGSLVHADGAHPIIVIGYHHLSALRGIFSGCTVSARIDNGVGVDNEEQGAPVWTCARTVEPWSTLWPHLHSLNP